MPQTAAAVKTLVNTEHTVVVQLGALENPATDEGHAVQYSVGKDRAGGRPMHADVTVVTGFRGLDAPGTELARWRHEDLKPGLEQFTREIPPDAVAKIADYSDLQMRVDFTRG